MYENVKCPWWHKPWWIAVAVISMLGWGRIEGKAESNGERLRAEAVSRGYAEWRHVDGARDAEFVWVETEGEDDE